MYLILVGGGNVGIQLAKRLIAKGHEVLLLEKDGRTAGKLANLIGDENVMMGDGCELYTQKHAGFNRADVVVAVTGEDEDNFVTCQLAKEVWNVQRVVARVNDPSHEPTFRAAGIDDTVSSTGIIFSLIDQQISSDEFIPVGHLHKGHVEVVETVISHRSRLAGKVLREIELPNGSFVVYLLRDGVGIPITGETEFQVGDTVVALVPTARADDLRQVMVGGVVNS
ncbi:MAG: TrkA family potassium uptake protein [Fimbriimonadaceae bacterium]|jgi:trk system potassium uptake protein TrkA|nr:TrkA family potassium uptake protein [Fimbriimonadaceae bacterium]